MGYYYADMKSIRLVLCCHPRAVGAGINVALSVRSHSFNT